MYSLWADCPISSDGPLRHVDMVECLLLGTDEKMIFQYILVIKHDNGMQEGVYR